MHKKRGQALIVIAMMLLGILALLALVFDTGKLYMEHAKLQRAADSAALAAAQYLPIGSDNPSFEEAERVGTEAFQFNTKGDNEVSMRLQFPADRNGNPNIAMATTERRVVNTFGAFLGYPSWDITSQAAARIGPIANLTEWTPIGIEAGEVELNKRIRLTSGQHDFNSEEQKRHFFPIDVGLDYRTTMKASMKSEIYVGQTLNAHKSPDVEKICEGLDDRVKASKGATGCFKVTDSINSSIDLSGLNIVGPGERNDWRYGQDPRLMYIPFVQPKGTGGQVVVVGFGLFYMEYAHYDVNPVGGSVPITEMVGYFVKEVKEGPIADAADNYGVIGIEYVDVQKLFK